MSPSSEARYLAAFFSLAFALAAASRSVFLRRDARFLTLSLPWLFPITPPYSLVLSKFKAVSQGRGENTRLSIGNRHARFVYRHAVR